MIDYEGWGVGVEGEFGMLVLVIVKWMWWEMRKSRRYWLGFRYV